MTAEPCIDHYNWAGGREAMLRFGPDEGPIVVLALPLFEEANRTRAFAGSICRALAGRGIGSVLPDMPGQGDSLVPLETLSVLDMQTAYEAAVRSIGGDFKGYAVGIRSGTLLDSHALLAGRWHFAPQTGAALLRDLARIRQIETGKRAASEMWWLDGAGDGDEDVVVTIAGNRLSEGLLTDLIVKEPFDEPGIPERIVRLASDPAAADRKVEGVPPWRRSEPGQDPALAALLADDIAEWIVKCEG